VCLDFSPVVLFILPGSEPDYYKELRVRLLSINTAVSTAALLNIIAVTFSSGIFWRMESVMSGSKIVFVCFFLFKASHFGT